ncbi:MAG: PQQ-dependent sugar dehydrogenase, partial [Bacteroidota bacterium]
NFGLPGAQGRNYIYTYYSTPSLTGAHDGPTPQRCKPQALFDGSYLVLRRYEVIDGTLTVDLTKTLDMIKIRLYNSTHRGGGMLFGNDGMLYVIIGDQAQHETAQEMEMSFDGGTLRLDVDMDPTRSHAPTYLMPKDLPRAPDETSGQGYFIPNDNPFVGWANTFEEYYTLGHRNPHRMTIDRQTGKMYIGEVGAGTHEEINIVKKGANYGWPVWEGPARKNVCVSALHPNTTHELPLVAFPRSVANSITGGYVYRGSAIPELAGKYICADYGGGGEIWSVDVNTGIYEQIGTTIGNTTKVISFGEDKSGELYLLAGGNSTALDRSNFEPLYRLVSPGSVDQLPRTLSATEAFSDLQNLTPSSGFVPYEMYESFWSDNALKKRWMMVPNNGSHDTPAEQIEYSENGEWLFPEGTVFIKHFELPIDENNPSITRRLETRFTVVGKDQKVYGVTYKWRADGSDADLLESSFDENIPIQTANGGMRNQSWHYPSFSECLTCHNETVGGTLGPRTRYLNTDFTYPSTGITANQLVTLSSLGMIPESITDASVSSLPKNAKMDEPTASLQTRARSYLDLNCGYCHRPGANNRAVFDARISTPLEASNLFSDRLNQSLGIAGERIIAAGDISRSVLYQRIHSVDPSIMMPPLAKSLIDEEGTALIAEWIGNLPADLDADDCIISNLALNKSTQQSSTYPGAVSSRAVDGNTNGEWAAGSVANTQDEANPWWEVDLGDTYFMHSVKVWSRINCCQDRLSDFYVISSAVPFTSQDLTATLNQPGVKVHRVEKTVIGGFEIPWLDEGRYIRVQLAGTNFLHLAEVEVYGCAVPQPLNIDCRNVAIAKPATQSSTWSGNTLNFDASNATDANTNGFDENNSITATQNEVQPWWEVDLGESY